MKKLSSVASKIRSKNAGPFWITIDIFCGTGEVFDHVSSNLKSPEVARVLQVDEISLKRFDIAELAVVKFSLPRPAVQGTVADRDMHGASFAFILGELEIAV